MTALENVEFALRVAGYPQVQRYKRASKPLADLDSQHAYQVLEFFQRLINTEGIL